MHSCHLAVHCFNVTKAHLQRTNFASRNQLVAKVKKNKNRRSITPQCIKYNSKPLDVVQSQYFGSKIPSPRTYQYTTCHQYIGQYIKKKKILMTSCITTNFYEIVHTLQILYIYIYICIYINIHIYCTLERQLAMAICIYIIIIIIIKVIFKCYFCGEHISLSINKNNNGANI